MEANFDCFVTTKNRDKAPSLALSACGRPHMCKAYPNSTVIRGDCTQVTAMEWPSVPKGFSTSTGLALAHGLGQQMNRTRNHSDCMVMQMTVSSRPPSHAINNTDMSLKNLASVHVSVEMGVKP